VHLAPLPRILVHRREVESLRAQYFHRALRRLAVDVEAENEERVAPRHATQHAVTARYNNAVVGEDDGAAAGTWRDVDAQAARHGRGLVPGFHDHRVRGRPARGLLREGERVIPRALIPVVHRAHDLVAGRECLRGDGAAVRQHQYGSGDEGDYEGAEHSGDHACTTG